MKHFRSKKHLENIKQNKVIIPEWLFKEPIENKIKKYSMIVYSYKTGEMDGRSYVKIPLRLNGILNIENEDKYCFFSSILAYLHTCNYNHPNRFQIIDIILMN